MNVKDEKIWTFSIEMFFESRESMQVESNKNTFAHAVLCYYFVPSLSYIYQNKNKKSVFNYSNKTEKYIQHICIPLSKMHIASNVCT